MNKFVSTEQNITLHDITVFEENLGYKFPESYKKHIMQHNGGKPEKDYIQGLRVSYFNPIKYGDDTLEDNIEDFKDLLPTGFLPFTTDWGGNPICISLKLGNNYGKIYYCPMDIDEIVPKLISNSFQEFINGLEENSVYYSL